VVLPRADRRPRCCRGRHHPQTLLATQYADGTLADPFGYPLRLRMSTKLGYKNPKWITAVEVTNIYPGGYWEKRGFLWFAEMLGEDEAWLADVAGGMDTKDGQLWVYGVGEHGGMAFTNDGIENLKDLVQLHKDDPSILDEQRRALDALLKPTEDK
jgi:hypothetical protein